MGWVEDKFLDDQAYSDLLPTLWNDIRDSVGLAVREFNEFNEKTKGHATTVSAKDCTARPGDCIRVQKNHPSSYSIEVFIDVPNRCIRTALSTEPDKGKSVCGYRLQPGRAALECFMTDKTTRVDSLASIEEVCRVAIGAFLFGKEETISRPLGPHMRGPSGSLDWAH